MNNTLNILLFVGAIVCSVLVGATVESSYKEEVIIPLYSWEVEHGVLLCEPHKGISVINVKSFAENTVECRNGKIFGMNL